MVMLPQGFELEQAVQPAQGGLTLPEGFEIEQAPSFDVIQATVRQQLGVEPQFPQGVVRTTGLEEEGLTRAAGGEIRPTLSPVEAGALEFMAGVNRGTINIFDFFGPDKIINAALELSGSETRIPTLGGTEFVQKATAGGFVEGLPGKILGTAGEVVPAALSAGGAIRQAAQALPRLAPGIESVGAGVLKQLGQSTAAGDVVLGAISGAGAEVGREAGGETGALVGSILAPTSAVGAKAALSKIISLGGRGISALTQSLQGLSDDGAATLLAEAMVRENLSPDDVVQRIAQLGPEAIPADVGNSFARLLSAASTKIPRIEGRAAGVFKARQEGQGPRILSAFDDATGTASLNVDDEIARLNSAVGPEVDRLYDLARNKPLLLTGRLNSILSGKTSAGRALKKIKTRIADKIAVGDKIENVGEIGAKQRPVLSAQAIFERKPVNIGIDAIDLTKQELDDQIGVAIRQGQNNKVRDLVRLKNIMVEEADTAIPEYKQARDLFAGKANLENAAESGGLFFKLKPRDVKDLVKTMGESEKQLFKLGAKRAIFDKIDDIQTTADTVKRLFGKNGDVKKLQSLFDNQESFNRFSKTLQREADFVLTRRAAQANSPTAKQKSDQGSASEALNAASSLISSPLGAANAFGRIVGGLSSKRGVAAFTKALEDVGDILLSKGMNPDRIQSLLRKGSAQTIERALRASIRKELSAPSTVAITTGAVAETLRETQGNQQ